MDTKEIFEKTYEKPGAIWTNKEPPRELVELIESGKIKPCKVLDVGCGEGKYAIYLAKKGFDVTGIDISEKAIDYAKENAKKAGMDVKFIAMDLKDLSELKEKFDLVLEWSILHCIPFEQWKKYIADVNNLLKDRGKYLSTCFNVQSSHMGKPGEKHRTVPEDGRAIPGYELYFSSIDELKELFCPYFKIIEAKLIQIENVNAGKTYTENYFFMEK